MKKRHAFRENVGQAPGDAKLHCAALPIRQAVAARVGILLHSVRYRFDSSSMKNALRRFLLLSLAALTLSLGACAGPTSTGGIQSNTDRASMTARIAAEPPGDYYIGRRYYKLQFKFWGYVRRPGQPWSTAQLVMMNEHNKLAPDRAANKLGSDNNAEYKLFGDYSGDKVYEPASNGMYPEFVLKDYELISTNPPPIFKSQRGGQPASTRIYIEKPE